MAGRGARWPARIVITTMPRQGRDDLDWLLFPKEGVHIGHQGSSQPPHLDREGVTIFVGFFCRGKDAHLPQDRHRHHARTGKV